MLLYRKVVFTILVLMAVFDGRGQPAALKAFLIKPGLIKMSRAKFAGIDSVSVNCNECHIVTYNIIITDRAGVRIQRIYDNKLPADYKSLVKTDDKCTIVIDDITVLYGRDTVKVSPVIVNISDSFALARYKGQ